MFEPREHDQSEATECSHRPASCWILRMISSTMCYPEQKCLCDYWVKTSVAAQARLPILRMRLQEGFQRRLHCGAPTFPGEEALAMRGRCLQYLVARNSFGTIGL